MLTNKKILIFFSGTGSMREIRNMYENVTEHNLPPKMIELKFLLNGII